MNAIDKSEMTDSEYEDMLTELYGTVTICGMEFDSGRALKELDRVAFDCGKSDYESENQKWECGECSVTFDNEEDAETCCTPECSECGETDKPLHTDGKCPDCNQPETK